MDWIGAVRETMKVWRGYGHVGDYKFSSFSLRQVEASRRLPGSDIVFADLHGDGDMSGEVLFELQQNPPLVSVVVNIYKGEEAVLMHTQNSFDVDKEDLDNIRAGNIDTMTLSIVAFLLTGRPYATVY